MGEGIAYLERHLVAMLGQRADDLLDGRRRIAPVHLRTVALTLLLGVLMATGCSDEDETVPVACRQGPGGAARCAIPGDA